MKYSAENGQKLHHTPSYFWVTHVLGWLGEPAIGLNLRIKIQFLSISLLSFIGSANHFNHETLFYNTLWTSKCKFKLIHFGSWQSRSLPTPMHTSIFIGCPLFQALHIFTKNVKKILVFKGIHMCKMIIPWDFFWKDR